MKKIFTLLFLVLIPLLSLNACVDNKSETKNIIYENHGHNFILKLPQEWEGKYDVVETNSQVMFFNKANKTWGGLLFTIEVWSEEKWSDEGEELTKIIHISKVGETEGKIFSFSTPTDVQYNLDDDSKKKEYLTMSDDIETIKHSFEIRPNESSIFDARKINVGDKIAGMEVLNVNVNSISDNDYYAIIFFSGKTELTGILTFYTDDVEEGWGLGNYFEPDVPSQNKIPVLNYEPERFGFTIVDNNEGELERLRQEGSQYKVKLIIDNFELYSQGKAQENRSFLIKLLDYQKIK